MAEVTSGSFYTSGYSDPKCADCFLFSWERTGYSIEGNYSDISWSLVGAGGTSSYWTYVREKYVTVDGTTQSNSTLQQIANGTVAFSGTTRIYHNADGKKTFSASAGGAFYYYGSYNSTGSGTWELPQIPRQANLTSAPSFTDEQNPTINYSNPAGNAVTSLQACISWTGGADITYRDIAKTGTSYTFDFTEAEREALRKSCTTAKSRSVIFYVKTVIGGKTFYSTIEKTLTIANANPTVGSFTYKDSNEQTVLITEDDQRIIRENSNLLFTVGTATALKSATVSKYEITFNGVTKSRTSAGELDFGIINLSSNADATLKVTDSRGNIATKQITVIIDDWKLPTGLITLNRKNNFYSETYLKVDATYSALNGKNAITIQYQYKKVSETNFSTLQDLSDNIQATLNLDNNYQWNIIVIVGDKIGETSYNLFLDRGIPIIFFDKLLSSVSINGFPSKEKTLEINGDIYANGEQIRAQKIQACYRNETAKKTYSSGAYITFKEKQYDNSDGKIIFDDNGLVTINHTGYMKVSFNVWIWANENARPWLLFKKYSNSYVYMDTIDDISSGYRNFAVANCIIPVTSGEQFGLQATTNTGEDFIVDSGNGRNSSYMTIELI